MVPPRFSQWRRGGGVLRLLCVASMPPTSRSALLFDVVGERGECTAAVATCHPLHSTPWVVFVALTPAPSRGSPIPAVPLDARAPSACQMVVGRPPRCVVAGVASVGVFVVVDASRPVVGKAGASIFKTFATVRLFPLLLFSFPAFSRSLPLLFSLAASLFPSCPTSVVSCLARCLCLGSALRC